MKPKNNKITFLDAELSRLREIIKLQSAHIRAADAALKNFADKYTTMLPTVTRLVEAANDCVNPTDNVSDDIVEMYNRVEERTDKLRKAIAAVKEQIKETK